MKFALNWVRDFARVQETDDHLIERLSLNGLSVEERIDAPSLAGIVVGKVVGVSDHPNANKLRITRVETGPEQLQIVCGAPNVAVGQHVPVALIDSVLPGGLKIKKAKIRGEESYGMICSKSELGLEEGKSDGIWVLPEPESLGQPLSQLISDRGTVVDLEIPANRSDCLSHLGIAREIAMIGNGKLEHPVVSLEETGEKAADLVAIDIEDPQGCPRYAARIVKNVTVGSSPEWLVQRLESVGLRSINNIVDVTNYVMLELGHPMHAFDYETISDAKIVVRASRAGEKFTTLDNKEHVLDDQAIMICDGKKPVALGGIMGGLNSEVKTYTRHVLLEAAYFDPIRIRKTSRKLNIFSDASFRFSRTADYNMVTLSLDRAAQLLQELAGGSVSKGVVDAYPARQTQPTIVLTGLQIERLLALRLKPEFILSTLEMLGCMVSHKNDKYTVNPPSFRPDLLIKEDIIEELARVYGYDNIASANQAKTYYENRLSPEEESMRRIRQALLSAGFNETLTNSMVDPASQDRIDPGGSLRLVRLLNPLNEEMSVMRGSLIPSLLEVMRGNLFQQNQNIRIFEIGKVYWVDSDSETSTNEKFQIVGLCTGLRAPQSWNVSSEVIDFFDLKGVLTTLFSKISLDIVRFNAYPFEDIFTSTAVKLSIEQGNEVLVIGRGGKLRRSLLKKYDIDQETWAFELDLAPLLHSGTIRPYYSPISKYPSVSRDLALIVDENILAGDILGVIQEKSGSYLEQLNVFDVYEGGQVDKQKKSLGVNFRFRAQTHTLTDGEIDETMSRILSTLQKEFNASLRDEKA